MNRKDKSFKLRRYEISADNHIGQLVNCARKIIQKHLNITENWRTMHDLTLIIN